MLYAFLGSLLAGAGTTFFVLWRKAQVEKQLVSVQKDLKQALKDALGWKESREELEREYNSLVDSANEEIATLRKEKEELLNALEKSGKPGVFADLLRKQNAKS